MAPGRPGVNPPRPARDTRDGREVRCFFVYPWGTQNPKAEPEGVLPVKERWWTITRAVLLTTVLLGSALLGPFLPVRAQADRGGFRDLADHWSRQEVEQAVAQGWVDGFPDGTFRPDSSITRAEFVRLLAAAIRLTPEGGTSGFLLQATGYAQREPEFLDVEEHWLMTEGWLKPALAFGLVIPSDYWENRFEPDRAVTRQEIAVMVVRALGLVYPATRGPVDLPFTDLGEIPDWAKGCVRQAVDSGVIRGYPDGTFGGSRGATRAEAVAMVHRALLWMEEGLDPEVKVFVKKPDPDGPPQAVDLPVPAQIIDGRVWVPARSVYEAAMKLYDNHGIRFGWNGTEQILSFEYGVSHEFQAGNDRYGIYTGLHQYSPRLPAPARLLYGELMIPAYDPDRRSLANLWYEPTWEPETKTLVLPVVRLQRPSS